MCSTVTNTLCLWPHWVWLLQSLQNASDPNSVTAIWSCLDTRNNKLWMFEIQIQNIEDNLYNGWSIYRQTFVIFHIFWWGDRWNWKLYSIVRISLIKAMVKKNSWAHLGLTKRLLSVRNGLLVNYEQQRKSLCQETNYAVRRRRQ